MGIPEHRLGRHDYIPTDPRVQNTQETWLKPLQAHHNQSVDNQW